MTESAASTAPASPPQTSFWEDLIDVFFQPVAMFRRRVNGNPWLPFLFVIIAMGIISYTTYPSIESAFEGDFKRTLPSLLKQYPQLTQEAAEKSFGYQSVAIRYFAGPAIGLTLLIDGFLVWLLGKMFGAVEGFGAAMLIASYAFFPRVLGGVIAGAQGLLMDPANIRGISMLTLGPARFLDPDTANPFTVALLSRLDLMVVWQTALLAIGLAVIGRVSRGKAIAFAVTIWIVGSLYLLRAAYLLS